jgi:light-regulated signal transduction histidine kinase (bacteriophytochrome)
MNAREASDEVARLRGELRQLLHACGHDLAEPARTVKSFLDLLERRHGATLEPEAREYVGFAVDAATRLQTMLGSLLEYARIGIEPCPDDAVHLEAEVEAALRQLEPLLEETGGAVEVGALPVVAGSARLWRRLFAILIENALVYRGPEPPVVRIEAGPGRITVADNGIGIEPRFRERIFEPFQRLHTRDAIPGCGMGLTIARRIAQHQGASLDVEAGPSGGSAFVVGLPAA